MYLYRKLHNFPYDVQFITHHSWTIRMHEFSQIKLYNRKKHRENWFWEYTHIHTTKHSQNNKLPFIPCQIVKSLFLVPSFVHFCLSKNRLYTESLYVSVFVFSQLESSHINIYTDDWYIHAGKNHGRRNFQQIF